MDWTHPAVSRRRFLDGAVIITALLASMASIIVHGARPAAGQASRAAAGPLTASVALLPVLPPSVEALTKPDSEASRAAALAKAAVPDPAARLSNAAGAPTGSAAAPASARTSRAQALPEVPLSAGPAASQSGADAKPAPASPASPAIANTLDSQYVEHTIVAGESLSSIATVYGMSVTTVVSNNPGLDDLDIIHPGQTLRIPTTKGLLYHVQAGDTLDGISRRYGVPLQDVISLPANGLQNADMIAPGQTILLPGDITPPAPPVIARALPAAPQVILQPPSQPAQGSASVAPPAPAATPVVPIARFIWPVQGPITQGFGVPELGVGSPHTGIDIGLYGRNGAPISAAAPGTVSFSGGDACCGYGYYVLVKHAGGFTTLYGHLSRRAVSVGDTVTQGETVGYAGSTGFSTGTHLHFEIQLNGAAQNPLRYLP